MFVFRLVVGSLLLGFGAIITMMSIEPTPLNASWDKVKNSFRIMSGKPRFWVGVICVVIGFFMIFGLMSALIR